MRLPDHRPYIGLAMAQELTAEEFARVEMRVGGWQIAHFLSEVLVLAAVNSDGKTILLQPDEEVELGARIA